MTSSPGRGWRPPTTCRTRSPGTPSGSPARCAGQVSRPSSESPRSRPPSRMSMIRSRGFVSRARRSSLRTIARISSRWVFRKFPAQGHHAGRESVRDLPARRAPAEDRAGPREGDVLRLVHVPAFLPADGVALRTHSDVEGAFPGNVGVSRAVDVLAAGGFEPGRQHDFTLPGSGWTGNPEGQGSFSSPLLANRHHSIATFRVRLAASAVLGTRSSRIPSLNVARALSVCTSAGRAKVRAKEP